VAHETGLVVLCHGRNGHYERSGGEQHHSPNHPYPLVPAARPPPTPATNSRQPHPPAELPSSTPAARYNRRSIPRPPIGVPKDFLTLN
jgi:hypothetical protein